MKANVTVLAIGALFLVSSLFAASPVLAAPAPTGAQLFTLGQCLSGTTTDSITYTASITFPANTPFFVEHGFAQSPWRTISTSVRTDFNSPGTNFTLWMDGTPVRSNPVRSYDHSTDSMSKEFLSNFPDGMAGTPTFTGQYFDHVTGLGLACVLTVTFT